ncbi:MAG: hypothetical protein MRJ93_13580 [Nitrososphaeraceae archaeon]|nr:hypothetical protein [Nitrososphaeraceae archaeon]
MVKEIQRRGNRRVKRQIKEWQTTRNAITDKIPNTKRVSIEQKRKHHKRGIRFDCKKK